MNCPMHNNDRIRCRTPHPLHKQPTPKLNCNIHEKRGLADIPTCCSCVNLWQMTPHDTCVSRWKLFTHPWPHYHDHITIIIFLSKRKRNIKAISYCTQPSVSLSPVATVIQLCQSIHCIPLIVIHPSQRCICIQCGRQSWPCRQKYDTEAQQTAMNFMPETIETSIIVTFHLTHISKYRSYDTPRVPSLWTQYINIWWYCSPSPFYYF